MELRVLSASNIRQAVSMADAIGAVRDAYVQLSAGQAIVPLRTPVAVDRYGGTALFMPAYLPASDALGAKIVCVYPRNRELGMPVIHAVVVVVEASTGRPLAIMDGTYLTALRTGAASGVATDLLARPDARVAAIFGAGAQARAQLEAVCTVRPIERVWVYDPLPGSAQTYADEMSARGRPVPAQILVARSPDEAAREADVICTATTSTTPVFDDADLKPGVHINAIGAYTPEMQEIPAATVARSRIVADSRSAVLAEAGDLIIPLRQGMIRESAICEVGEVAAGKMPGRQSELEITLFKSVGLAIQDLAVARLVLRRAVAQGLGASVEL